MQQPNPPQTPYLYNTHSFNHLLTILGAHQTLYIKILLLTCVYVPAIIASILLMLAMADMSGKEPKPYAAAKKYPALCAGILIHALANYLIITKNNPITTTILLLLLLFATTLLYYYLTIISIRNTRYALLKENISLIPVSSPNAVLQSLHLGNAHPQARVHITARKWKGTLANPYPEYVYMNVPLAPPPNLQIYEQVFTYIFPRVKYSFHVKEGVIATFIPPDNTPTLIQNLEVKIQSPKIFGLKANITRWDIVEENSHPYVHSFTVSFPDAAFFSNEYSRRNVESIISNVIGDIKYTSSWMLSTNKVQFAKTSPLPTLAQNRLTTRFIPQTTQDILNNYDENFSFTYAIDNNENYTQWHPVINPHHLIVGKTGKGKSVSILTIITQAAAYGWIIIIVDFKGDTYSGMLKWPNVVCVSTNLAESICLVDYVANIMDYRNSKAKTDPYYRDKQIPILLVFDEYTEFANLCKTLWKKLKPKNSPQECHTVDACGRILRLARSARIHVIIGMQRPDVKLLEGEMREQLEQRSSLGNMSPEASRMMWESSRIGSNLPLVRGRGISITNHGLPKEMQFFFTPDPFKMYKLSVEEKTLLAQLYPAQTFHERKIIYAKYEHEVEDYYDLLHSGEMLDPHQHPHLDRANPTHYIERDPKILYGNEKLHADLYDYDENAKDTTDTDSDEENREDYYTPDEPTPIEFVEVSDLILLGEDEIEVIVTDTYSSETDETITISWRDAHTGEYGETSYDPHEVVQCAKIN